MGLFKNNSQKKSYDKDNKIPVIKCSICTGEQVAGFLDIHTERFEDVMLIKSDDDLKLFKEQYGIAQDIQKIY